MSTAPTRHRPRRALHVAAAAIVTLGTLTACGSPAGTTETSEPAATSDGDTTGYPVTIDNCGEDLVIESRPESVMLLASTVLGTVEAAGGLDQIGSRTWELTGDHWSEAIEDRVAEIPALTEAADGSGVTLEAIVEAQPDLVIGYESQALSRETLAAVGIPFYIIPAYCPESPSTVSFDSVYEQVTTFGEIFGHPDAAATANEELKTRVEAVSQVEGDIEDGAMLFTSTSSGSLLTYGTASMSNAQLDGLGIRNVFDDIPKRYLETSIETLVDRDPDVIVVLYPEGKDAEDAINEVVSLPGADALSAVANNRVIAQKLELTDPPNPYSVLGLEELSKQVSAFAASGN
ncbi:MAG: ABC transporter substrate-binding protein [Microbacterium sp.]